jgi:WhiB family redox-sensing transcriptional regulator
MAPTHHEKTMIPAKKPGTATFPLHPFDEDPNWADDAACKGSTELFYPERGDNAAVKEAKKICAICPIKQKCLDYALWHNERIGIWGGTTDRDRERIKQQAKHDSEPHGTHAGWMMHYRRKQPPCEPCKNAKNIYQNEKKRLNRLKKKNEPTHA